MNNIQDITSTGLSGLPHFKTSRISMNMWEPIYQNLFTVAIQLPDAIRDLVDSDLLLEGIQKIDGLDTDKTPGAGTTQHYKFADRRFADSGPADTHIDVKFDFEINISGSAENAVDMFQVKALRKWNDLVFDPLTGRQGIKAEYVAPQVVITMHDKAHNPFWQWTLYHVWPTTNITPVSLDYMNKNNVYKVTGYTLACDYWDEVQL